MKISNAIDIYITDNGIKQNFLSNKTGLSCDAISNVLKGRRKLEVDEYAKICEALNVSFDFFYDLRKEIENKTTWGERKMYYKFAELLKKNSLTPYRVAKDTGISQSSLSDWKVGRAKPKADKLLILAKYFGVTIEYFLEADETLNDRG